MKSHSFLIYILLFLVAITFSVIGWVYQYNSSLFNRATFYSALFSCIVLLLFLIKLQKKYYNTQLTEISETLTESIDRDWLQGLFTHFPMGMLIVDKQSRILYANHQTCIIFKTDQKAITEHTIETLVSKEARNFFVESIAKENSSPLRRDEFLISGDKKIYTWYALNVCSIPLTKTKPGIWSITIEDVTAKRVLRDKLDKIRTEQSLILDHTTVGLLLVVNKKIVRANNALGQLLGRYSSSMVNQPWEKVIHGQEDGTDILDKVVRALSNSDYFESEVRLLRDDGKLFWSRMTAKAASFRSMKSGIIISFEDATNKREQDDELRQAAVVFEASSDAIMVLDEEGLIRMVNSSFSKMTGFSEIDILGKTPRLLRATREDERRYDIMWETVLKNGHWRGELWRRKKSGETYPEWTSISAVKDSQDRVLEYVVIGSDMSDRKYAEDRILHQANYDQLTSLPNRNLFMDRLHQSLTRVKREGTQLALLFIDLDRFKNINDSLGHSAGDKLLVEVAKLMKYTIRDSDTIARFGGDEFAVILSPVFGPKNASRVAHSLLEVLSQPVDLDGYEAIIGASIGISMFPADGTVEDVLVKNADTAMYRAKESGRNNYQFFTEEMQQSAKDRLTMEQDLRQAIERQELRLVFQPQVELSKNQLCGTEVLVRWQRSDKGLISPNDFIYIAEDTGLIVPIGDWVLRHACLQYKRWLNAGVAPPYIAINVSGRQFKMDGFSQSVLNVLNEVDLSTKHVELELTESYLMDDQEFSINTLKELKEMGFQLAIDDFGTGYSSLSYLKKFPIDRLKIDRSFIKEIDVNKEDYAIVRAIIELAHTLNISVIAEGVEEEAQKQILKELNCDIIQGFLYSKPLDGVSFTLYLQQYK